MSKLLSVYVAACRAATWAVVCLLAVAVTAAEKKVG